MKDTNDVFVTVSVSVELTVMSGVVRLEEAEKLNVT